MEFKPATKDDLKTVMSWIADAQACHLWAGPKVKFPLVLNQLCEALEFERRHTYSLHDETQLLALGQVRLFENNRGHLSRIIINPQMRGRGIGKKFCSMLIDRAGKINCTTISLNVIKDNDIAIKLYKSLGFIIPDEAPSTTRDDCMYMELG